MRTFRCLVVIFGLCVFTGLAFAQIPRALSYQGVLTDTSGNPKPDGSYSLTFRIYQTSSAGSALWNESKSLTTRRGMFYTLLGDATPIPSSLAFDRQYWLGVQVGADPELSPRVPLSSVGYSLSAVKADTALYALSSPPPSGTAGGDLTGTYPNPTVTSNAVTTAKLADNAITSAKILNGTILFADIAQNGAAAGQVMKWSGSSWSAANDTAGSAGPWQTSGSSAYYNTGFVGIGTTTPASILDVSGSGIIRSRINSNSNAGLSLTLNNQPGWSMATVGGGQFQIYNDATGQNAFWIDAFTNKIGVGTTTPGARVHAVDPVLLNDAPAVYGEHAVNDFYGIGVKGVSMWKGVEGIVTATGTSTYYGVRGEVFQSGAGGNKYGVYGTVTGTGSGTKVAVGGEVTSGVGIGVSGIVTANDVNSTGVYGYAQPLGRAVYANGNLVTSGAKLFQIDHPLDPANKMLNHYCTEGPEPLNVYSGMVNLDGSGVAWITLPTYFQSINKDFRYQLTPVGASMPNLFIAEEIQGNRFKIGGGKPGMKVSWQVSATRNDLYVQRAGIPVEVDKTGDGRGKYLVPELFGMPPERGIFWQASAKTK